MSRASPTSKRSVTAVPCRSAGIANFEHTRCVIVEDGIWYRPPSRIVTPEKKSGSDAGVSVTPALIPGGGGARFPPAGEPALLSAEPSVNVPSLVSSCARKKFSNGAESLLTNW